MGYYGPPPEEEDRPATLEEADAENVVGRENRAKVGLGSGYGGRSGQELDYINYETQLKEQQRQQEQQKRVASGQDPSYQSGNKPMKYQGWETDAENGQQQQPERTYLEGLQNRPRYVDSSQVGDTRTQDYLRMTDTLRQMGMPVPDREKLVGKILEGQRKVAEGTPGTRDDQFFLNELSKWNTKGIESSSAEHYYKKQSANPKDWTANTQENWGDVALAVEKGGNPKDFTIDKYGFNPNVRGALGYTKPMKYEGWEGDAAAGQQQTRQVGGVLPEGKGLQETAWSMAKSGQPANVDFQPAVDYVNYQKGRMGPYGNLYGGTPDTTPDMPPRGGTPGAAPVYDEAGAKRPFVSANAPEQQTPTGKDWNPFVASAAEPTGYISEGIQLGKTELTPEQQKWTDARRVIPNMIFSGFDFAISIPVGFVSMFAPGIIPKWEPEDSKVTIKSTDPLKETIIYGTTTKTFSGGNQTITNLGNRINQDKGLVARQDKELETLLKGKIVGGEFSGTTEEYATVKSKIDARNLLAASITKDAETYNAMSKENPIIETATTPQTVLTTGTPDKVYKFGYWQMASEEWGNKAMGALGYNRQQLEAYGTTLKSKPGISGEAERAVYNIMKPAIESPMDLPVYYLEGKMFAGVIGGTGEAVAQYGRQGTGKIATVAKVLTTPGEGGTIGSAARGITKWGVPVTFVAATGYEVTNKGTDFSKETVLTNLESGVVPMALMTYGAMGTEPFRGGYEYGKARFQEKPMIRETYKTEATLTERPDIQVPSGIGGSMKIVETKTIATQPSVRIAGYDVTFPRIFEPKARGGYQRVTDLSQIDMGTLTEARLLGATTEPVVYSRVVETKAETFRGGYTQTGPYSYERPGITQATGTLKTDEMRLPRTFEEYLKMGEADAKLTGQPQEAVTAQLMADAAKVTEPKTGYRELSATVPAGSPIEQMFDWNVVKGTGKEVEFGKIEMEDYFGRMQVTQKGGGASDYQITVERDITAEQGFSKGGSYDVTGSQVPEAKIVRQLQEISKGIKAGDVERGFTFDNRGNLIYEKIGDLGSVDMAQNIDILGNIEGTGSLAHVHPIRPKNFIENLKFDINEARQGNAYLNLLYGEASNQIYGTIYEKRGFDQFPSYADVGWMGKQGDIFVESNAIQANYIASKKGVTIMRIPERGWERYRALSEAAIIDKVGNYDPLYPQHVGETMELGFKRHIQLTDAFEIPYEFVGKSNPYSAKAISERIPDATAEMQASYPVGVRNQFVDIIDRTILKDPNLEFIREGTTPKEKPLSQSGSNIGRGGGGGFVSSVTTGGRVMSQQIQTPTDIVGVTAQPQIFKSPDIVRPAPSGQTPRQISEPVLAFQQISTPTTRQTSRQKQEINQRFPIELAQAFVQPEMQMPRQNQGKEYSQIFKVGSGFKLIQTPEQTSTPVLTQGVWQTPLQGQQQTPIQEQAQIQRQQQIPRIQTPPPLTPQIYGKTPTPLIGIPGLPVIPDFGGPVGPGTKRRGRRFTELFPLGLDLQVYNWNKQKRPHAKAKKGRIIPAKRAKKK